MCDNTSVCENEKTLLQFYKQIKSMENMGGKKKGYFISWCVHFIQDGFTYYSVQNDLT